MATRSAVRSDVVAMLGTDPQISSAELNTLIQLRYSSVYEGWTWPRRLRDFTLSLVASTSSTTSNTVTVTLDSSTVTSAGTPFTSAMVGRQIQIGAEPQYFFVNSFTSSAVIVIGNGEGTAVSWPRATNTAASWTIFQPVYALPSDADGVVALAGQFDVDEIDGGRASLDQFDPERTSSSSHPTGWCYAGETSAGVREIEVWPVPSTAIILRGQYARRTPTLSDDADEIGLPRSVIVYGVATEACGMMFAKTGDEAWSTKAGYFGRKASEEEDKFRAIEIERSSPPWTLRRRTAGFGRFRGTDFEVSHDLEALD